MQTEEQNMSPEETIKENSDHQERILNPNDPIIPPEKFDWANKWLKGDEYAFILKNIDTYTQKYGLEKLSKKTHPENIYTNPKNGMVYFVEGNSVGSEFGFPRVDLKKRFRWKKMNFTTDLPKKKPFVTYIVASAVKCEKFFPNSKNEGPSFRMHAVILNPNGRSCPDNPQEKEKTIYSVDGKEYILCHIRKIDQNYKNSQRGGGDHSQQQQQLQQSQTKQQLTNSIDNNQLMKFFMNINQMNQNNKRKFEQYFLQHQYPLNMHPFFQNLSNENFPQSNKKIKNDQMTVQMQSPGMEQFLNPCQLGKQKVSQPDYENDQGSQSSQNEQYHQESYSQEDQNFTGMGQNNMPQFFPGLMFQQHNLLKKQQQQHQIQKNQQDQHQQRDLEYQIQQQIKNQTFPTPHLQNQQKSQKQHQNSKKSSPKQYYQTVSNDTSYMKSEKKNIGSINSEKYNDLKEEEYDDYHQTHQTQSTQKYTKTPIFTQQLENVNPNTPQTRMHSFSHSIMNDEDIYQSPKKMSFDEQLIVKCIKKKSSVCMSDNIAPIEQKSQMNDKNQQQIEEIDYHKMFNIILSNQQSTASWNSSDKSTPEQLKQQQHHLLQQQQQQQQQNQKVQEQQNQNQGDSSQLGSKHSQETWIEEEIHQMQHIDITDHKTTKKQV